MTGPLMRASTHPRTTLKGCPSRYWRTLRAFVKPPGTDSYLCTANSAVILGTVTGCPFSLVRLRPLNPTYDETFDEIADSSRANHQS